MRIDKNREAEKGTHKTTGKFPPSVSNFCSGCGKDLGPNITPRRIVEHKCKE